MINMHFKGWSALLIALALTTAFAACKGKEEPQVQEEKNIDIVAEPSLTVSPYNLYLRIEASEQLVVTGYTAAGEVVENLKATFKSDDETIARVSSSGMVSAESIGSAVITVTAVIEGVEVTGKSYVEVTPPIEATAVHLLPDTLFLAIGQTGRFTLDFEPENTTEKVGLWDVPTVSMLDIIDLASDGLITAKAGGKATVRFTLLKDGKIPAASERVRGEAIVIVSGPVSPTAFDVIIPKEVIYTGETMQLSLRFFPSNTTEKDGTWSSSNPSVATVDENGLLTAHTVGYTFINFTHANGREAQNKSQARVQVVQNEFVDLGLSDGTLWKMTNEDGTYSHESDNEEIINALIENTSEYVICPPTADMFRTLINECTITWEGSAAHVVGPNGNAIDLPAVFHDMSQYDSSYNNYGSFYYCSTVCDTEGIYAGRYYEYYVNNTGPRLILETKVNNVECYLRLVKQMK